MNIQIKDRYTGSILFECDAESMKSAVRLAIEAKADLREANLRGCNMSGSDLSRCDLRGSDLSGCDLRGCYLGGKRIVSVSGIGSSRRLTNYDCDNDIVWCGCFTGSLAEFAAKIEETHKDAPRHLADYRAAVAFFTVCKNHVTA